MSSEGLGMTLWSVGFHSALPGTVPIRLDFENLLLPGSWRQEESNVPKLENST